MDFFLLDTNLFREATKSPDNKLLNALIPALRSRGLEFGLSDLTAIRISPFALLETLGVVPTMPPKPDLKWRGRDPKEIYRELFDYACEFFRNLPELQDGRLRQKHAEQVAYVTPEARPLFDTCVTGILNRGIDITGVFATFLADDYFFKYPFTRDAFIAMGAFFGAAFFSDVPEESPVSRFRLTMRMFDLIRENMRALPGYEQQARALSVKNSRDLLDTDIVQDVTYGYPHKGLRHRVVALTFDEAKIVEVRACLHRQVGFSMAAKCTGADFVRTVVQPFLAHPGGLVIQCNQAGAIFATVDLSARFPAVEAASRLGHRR
jgi:hypothetical protein